ncbi:MAG: hypothetical protein Ct9H300mP1_05820 [Planctomycetaceae bacterium]|nr:MAG: hypothetical protein Ct9H300mP1_05820 [Planctomycetaceae bacterium]
MTVPRVPRAIMGAPPPGIFSRMFLDRVTIHCLAGDGGSGSMSFRREAQNSTGRA